MNSIKCLLVSYVPCKSEARGVKRSGFGGAWCRAGQIWAGEV